MPKTCKIKNKVVQSTINNKDVLEMFHGVLGTGEETALNLKIVYPKFLKIKETAHRYIKLMKTLMDSKFIGHFPDDAAALAAYVASLQRQAENAFMAPDLASLHPPDAASAQITNAIADYSAVSHDEYSAFEKVYKAVKGCDLVNNIIITCKNLIPFKHSLEFSNMLKDKFLTKSGGLLFTPISNFSFNFKNLYNSDMLSRADKQFVMMILHKLYEISHAMYDVVSSPDIDVDDFVHVIISSLDDVKKHIPRCDEAFDKIRDSVSLLKGNFNGYYKDFVASNNPTIIMENFVLDVSQNTNSTPKITNQFRKIISHYRKLASQQAHNPQMQTLFAQVDKNFKELDNEFKKNANEEQVVYDGSSDDEKKKDPPPDTPSGLSEDEKEEGVSVDPSPPSEAVGKHSSKNRKRRDKETRKKIEKIINDSIDS